jgi:hypothetical protein
MILVLALENRLCDNKGNPSKLVHKCQLVENGKEYIWGGRSQLSCLLVVGGL